MKLWEGMLTSEIDTAAASFNSSISFDYKLLPQDIIGSLAHGEMLFTQGIISPKDWQAIQAGLEGLLTEHQQGTLAIDSTAEDVHTFVEQELTKRIGEPGKRLHTARSRNDQVATDTKLYTIAAAKEIEKLLAELVESLCTLADTSAEMIMPGYTHLQRAQPITFGHHLMAYAFMFLRDRKKLQNSIAIMEAECPLGSGALAGTTYPIDRCQTAELLGFSGPYHNSMDGVSDRDFCLDVLYLSSTIMTHLSRFCEEIILWCSWEYQFISLDDSFSTGSSIMPQKKNPDIAELIRGKTGRVYGNLLGFFTMMKGLPLAYNKDMQEDKEALFDSVETVQACLTVFIPMLQTIAPKPENMLRAASQGFLNATDCADYLVAKGMAFRDAYRVVGSLVRHCMEQDTVLEAVELAVYQEFSPLFSEDIYQAIDLVQCVKRRTSHGGPATVAEQIQQAKRALQQE